MLRPLFILLLCLIGSIGLAQQVNDTTSVEPRIPTVVRFSTETDFLDHRDRERAPDTSVARLHEVFVTDSGDLVHLGNSGSAVAPIGFQPLRGLTTSLGFSAYSVYGAGPEEQYYYRTNKRYSRIDYLQGAFRESSIRFLHTQNVTRGLNLGLTIDRFTVKEWLPEGDTYFNRISLFGSYCSPDRRYALFAHASWMRIRNQVNGGLVNDSAFLAGSVDNLGLKGAAVRLSDADQRVRRRELYLSQYYQLGKRSDTDTTDRAWRIGWSLRYRRDAFTYLDQATDSSFYEQFYLDPTATYDSSMTDQLVNRFLVERKFPDGAFIPGTFGLYAEDQRMHAYQRVTTNWSNQVAGLNLRLGDDSSRVALRLNAARVIDGQDAGNSEWSAALAGWFLQDCRWQLRAEQQDAAVPFIFRSYSGNHLEWKNDFRPQSLRQLTAGLHIPRWRLSIEGRAIQVDDFLYVGYEQKPEQSNEQLRGMQVDLSKEFRLGKWGLNNRVRYQSFSDADRVRLPDLILQHSLFYENTMFNNALLLRAGLDAWYCDAWNGAAFSPSTSLFFLQKAVETGGYLRTDLFLNLKIKTAGLFLRFTNITDGLGAKAYTLIPGYPQPGRVFHFGVRWMFYDQ
jgi:hypothetical protein